MGRHGVRAGHGLAMALAGLVPLAAFAQAPDAGVAAELSDAGAGPARMVGLVDEAFQHLARARNADGLAALQRGDLPAALARFREARDLDPENSEHTNNLAYLHFRLGNVEDAERWYRETIRQDPDRFIAHLNLADLLSAPTANTARLQEAATLLVRARELRGNDAKVVLRQARIAARLGQFEAADRFYRALVDTAPPDAALAVEIGDFHRDFAHFDDALTWYRKFPEAGADRIRALEVEREARRWGMLRVAADVPAPARALAARGRVSLVAGRLVEAQALLDEALHLAPRFSAARADLADALSQLGRIAEAERQLLLGLALDHGDAELHLRLARLYRPTPEHPGVPTRAGESLILLTQALQLEPDRVELDWEAALSAQATGDLGEALRHVRRYLARAPADAPDQAAAQGLLQTLEGALGPNAGHPGGAAAAAHAPDGAASPFTAAINRARSYLSRGEADAALAELSRVEGADQAPDVLVLRARILHAAGRLDEAADALTQAIDASPDRNAPALETELGVLRAEQGRPKEARLNLAVGEAAGLPEARLALARLDVDLLEAEGLWSMDAVHRLAQVHERLQALAEAGEIPRRDPAALERLTARADALSEKRALALAGLVVVLLAAVGAWAQRRFGGKDLAALLARHPEAGPEVQRILSAIRHEVLKHNTLMLSGLIDALAQGAPAAEKATFCRKSLLGEPGAPGAQDRLRAYAAGLQQVGRAHGLRLNLERRDPALSALNHGFALLRAAERDLRRVESLGPRATRALLRRLEQAAHLLNVEGYEAVRVLLDGLRVLLVDATTLTAIYERARREPALSGVRLEPPDVRVVAATSQAVAVPRDALEDILVNLVRNAIQSTLRHGPAGSVRIGLVLDEEIDEITGLGRAVFSVLDCSPQTLTREMLRGRYIEAGLGLTADLVSRYDGTLDVGPAPPPYTKAVVVKLPQATLDALDGSTPEARR